MRVRRISVCCECVYVRQCVVSACTSYVCVLRVRVRTSLCCECVYVRLCVASACTSVRVLRVRVCTSVYMYVYVVYICVCSVYTYGALKTQNARLY